MAHKRWLAIGLLGLACNLTSQPAAQVITPLPTLLPTPTALPITPSPSPLPLPPPPGLIVQSAETPTQPMPTLEVEELEDSRIQVQPGQKLAVYYIVAVTKGSLTLALVGPDKEHWRQTFINSQTGRFEMTAEWGGEYELIVIAQNFDGHYVFRWD